MNNGFIRKHLFFSKPDNVEKFVLKESKEESESQENAAKRQNQPNKDAASKGIQPPPPISRSIDNNLKYMKRRFSVPINSDVVIREFDVVINNSSVRAFILFYEDLIDKKIINSDILQPMMLLSNIIINDTGISPFEYIRKQLIPISHIRECYDFNEIINEVNLGSCALFIDGLNSAFTAEAKGFKHRAIDKPNTEQNIRGPQEGFNEILAVNISMVRRRLNDEDLIIERIKIGERSKTPCAMLYIKDITNDQLISEVRRRLTSVKIDYLHSTGQLEQLIEDSPYSPSPQILATERPDRVAAQLTKGKVAVLVNGGVFALVMPVVLEEFIKTSEDQYIRFPYTSILRMIRIVGMVFALLLPGIYLAITNYHQEMIPTSLLLAISVTREKVPFPSIIEILIMEASFELIREAGIRIPGIIGPTIGIIGALILGQAAVAANIVSPILIVIVAVTGIGSFAIPDYSFSYTIRFLRFGFIFFGFIAGFLGIITALFLSAIWLAYSKSFGIPLLTPFGPKTNDKRTDELKKPPLWKEEKRSDYLNPKDITRESIISRGWSKSNGKGGNGSE